MTITFPRTLPASRGFSRWEWMNKDVVAVSQSEFSQASRAYDWMGSALVISAEVILASIDEAYEWAAFVEALKGTFGTFTMGPPSGVGATPRGIGTGTPLVNGANQTGPTLITDGWTISQTGILKAWDWMSIESRLYAVLVAANSDGSGNATFDIWPRLRKSPADNAPITVTNPTGTWRFIERPTVSFDITPYVRVPFTAIEDVTFA